MSVESTRPEDLRMDVGALLAAVSGRWLRILMVTVLALMATWTILLFVPRMYESTAGLLVEERSNALARTANEAGSSEPSIPVEAMMSSQIELIKSRDTLLDVIDSENLRSEPELTESGFSPIGMIRQLFGREPAISSIDARVLGNLTDGLKVIRERDSAVISVIFQARDPDLAARVANAVARAHVQRRAELSLSDTAAASEWLEQEIERLREQVREAEHAVADYRVTNDLMVGPNDTSIRDQQLSAIATQITAAQERKNAALSRANLIRGLLEAGQPIVGVEDVRASVVIQQLSQSLATLRGELAQSSSTLLSNHPTIKALGAQIAEIEDQIALEGRRVAEALEAEAEIEADLEQSLRDELALMKLDVSTATRDTVALQGLEREARAKRDLLESYLLKYSDAISRTDASSALPDVRVVTVAAPSVQPASPNSKLILAAVGFVAVALQVGGILFGELLSGRALTERSTFARAPAPDLAETTSDDPDLAETGEASADAAPYKDPEPELPLVASAEPDLEEGGAEEPPVEAPADDDRFGLAHPFAAEADLAVLQDPSRGYPEVPATEASPEVPDAAAGLDDAGEGTAPEPAAADGLALSTLSADIALGRVRMVLLAGLLDAEDCAAVSDSLIADAQRRGLSVARVDAGSGRPSVEPGLTDLSAELVSFGDVVHKVREGLAEVPWGHEEAIERRSMRPLTLLEALTDIYEVVIVNTGRIGMASSLPVFTGLDCRLVLVEGSGSASDPTLIAAAVDDAAALGYEIAQVVAPPQQHSEVA